MNNSMSSLLMDRAKKRATELNGFYIFDFVVAIILYFCNFSYWWLFPILIALFCIAEFILKATQYLDLCSCLLEEQNEILKEKE